MAGLREIVFDTETTGFEPSDGHRIIEIGCVELIDSMETGRTFHHYIHPERDIPEEATNVHGITLEMLEGKPVFADIADEFVAFVDGATLVAHNADFDMKFLNAELEWCGRPRLPNPVKDTLKMARRKHPGQHATLDALLARYGIDARARTVHGALLDASLLVPVYIRLEGRDQLIREERSASRITAVDSDLMPASACQTWFPRREILQPSSEELDRHAAFLGKIKDPVWNRQA